MENVFVPNVLNLMAVIVLMGMSKEDFSKTLCITCGEFLFVPTWVLKRYTDKQKPFKCGQCDFEERESSIVNGIDPDDSNHGLE